MSAPFAIDEWVTWGGGIFQIARIDGNRVHLAHGGLLDTRDVKLTVVRVIFPKPKRKLKPSAALAWLDEQSGGSVVWDRANGWRATCNALHAIAHGKTMCKAIIAARKAMGVKS